MIELLINALDVAIIVTSAVAAWLWLKASQGSVRRVSYHEELDAKDLNRLVVALNRSLLLNRRAALATALVTVEAAIRAAIDFLF
ncbi:MAG: hypothetical protein INF91_01365 [Alphaproteobacteria bacterium]|nr:hypothetical protein [Alphaproteobacteria bacterium]